MVGQKYFNFVSLNMESEPPRLPTVMLTVKTLVKYSVQDYM